MILLFLLCYYQKKNNNSRLHFKKRETQQKIKKCVFTNILNNKSVSSALKSFFLKYFLMRKKRKTKTQIKSYCVMTNKSKSVYKPFGISRIYLREMIQFGLLPGYSKAVW